MRNKPADVPYCGVRKSRIHKAEPTLDPEVLMYLYRFITRRYKIHIKKDVEKLPAPWTSDPVLSEFRFTNVRREHDRETKWVIKNITSNPELSYEDKLLNCILFRLYNKHETSELISQPIHFAEHEDLGGWDPEWYRALFEAAQAEDPKRVFFTGAFITGGLKRALKWYLPKDDPKNSMEMRMLWFIRVLMDDKVTDRIRDCSNQQDVFKVLCSYDGLGAFLAYQIFVDMTYIEEFPFSENEFTVAGPGCRMGLGYLFRDSDGMTPEECLFWLRDNLEYIFCNKTKGKFSCDSLFRDLPKYDRCFNVMSLENCFCELSKYVRAIRGTGRPRKKYKEMIG